MIAHIGGWEWLSVLVHVLRPEILTEQVSIQIMLSLLLFRRLASAISVSSNQVMSEDWVSNKESRRWGRNFGLSLLRFCIGVLLIVWYRLDSLNFNSSCTWVLSKLVLDPDTLILYPLSQNRCLFAFPSYFVTRPDSQLESWLIRWTGIVGHGYNSLCMLS